MSKPNEHPTVKHNNKQALDAIKLLAADQLICNRWQVSALMSAGGFGQIYCARDTHKHNQHVAIKAEPIDAQFPMLHIESRVMQLLNQRYAHSSHFLAWHGYAHCASTSLMIMELCGENLRELKKKSAADRLSTTTSLWLALQIIDAVKMLHKIGWIHRDLKPANLCIGRSPNTRRCVYLIDFGLARCFIDEAGKLKPQRAQSGFHGTTRYASLNTHCHRDLGRVDDLWSIFYMIVENICGQLPWRKMIDKEQVATMKMNCNLIDLIGCHCQQPLPKSIINLHRRLIRYAFDTQPNYASIIDEIKHDLLLRAFNIGDALEWEMPSGDHI